MSTTPIYVRLVDEGTEVVRPTTALNLGDGIYQLIKTPDYDPEDECWEFLPGSRVRGVETVIGGESLLLAAASESAQEAHHDR